MKKSILAIAVAATMAAPAAMAGAPTVYGNVHVSLNQFDKSDGTGAGTGGDLDLSSHTSAIGVKGSEDLGDGMKAIYKVEFQLDAADGGSSSVSSVDTGAGTVKTSSNGNALTQRDVFVGLKGGMGTIKFGTMSSNYKQKGGKVDALYRTPVEGRGFIQTQSRLHNGRATNRGRMTNTVQYSSPKMGGIQLVVNGTASDSKDETVGVGVRYQTKSILAYVDWIDTVPGGAAVTTASTSTESAVKIGGKFSAKKFFIGGQFEDAEDVTGNNYIHVNGGFNINKNNAIIATFGQASHVTTGTLDTTGIAVAYNHKLSKMTNVYLAYGDRSSDTASKEDSVIAAGIKKKF